MFFLAGGGQQCTYTWANVRNVWGTEVHSAIGHISEEVHLLQMSHQSEILHSMFVKKGRFNWKSPWCFHLSGYHRDLVLKSWFEEQKEQAPWRFPFTVLKKKNCSLKYPKCELAYSKPLADKGDARDVPPPLQVQFLSFSFSVQEKN